MSSKSTRSLETQDLKSQNCANVSTETTQSKDIKLNQPKCSCEQTMYHLLDMLANIEDKIDILLLNQFMKNGLLKDGETQ